MQTQSPRPVLQHIFFSPEEPRLRAGWRLVGQAFFLLLAFMVFGGLYSAALSAGRASGEFFGQAVQVGGQVVSLLSITLSVVLARRRLDHRSFSSLGVRFTPSTLTDLGFGILLAALLMAGVYAVLSATGWLQVQGVAWDFDTIQVVAWQTALNLLLFILIGWQEELLFRGYQLQNLAASLGLPLGVFLSSTIFAVLHLGNPGAGWQSALGILAAGLFLAYGYVRTRSLWLPIGLHIGWNFFEGTVFGFQVSGAETYRLIRHTIDGPELLTGGAFGPEAGLLILPFLALGAGMIYAYTRGRNQNREAGDRG